MEAVKIIGKKNLIMRQIFFLFTLYHSVKAFIEKNKDIKMGICNSENFIRRMQRGRQDALEWTYDRYVYFVKSIIYKVLSKFNDNRAIDECINDVFVSVWDNCGKFKGDKDN